MATKKVSALTAKTSPSGSEELLINDAGTSKKITIANAFTDTDTTYSAGSSSALGLIKLEDDTAQTTAAESVTTTANRTYGLQINGSGQGVVNVPWSDTDTNTNQLTTFTVSATTDTTPTTISQGDDLMFTAGTGITCETTADGTVTITNTVTDTNTTYSAGDFKLDDLGAPDDNTDLDFSTSAHGLVPKGTDTGNFLKDDGTWAAPTDTNTTYSAGAGLDLSTTTFSVESDLRSDVQYIGQDTNDYYYVNTTSHDWYLDGVLDMRLENDGDLHADGDVIAYSTTTASDRKLKDNITTVEDALDKVKQLNGVEFTWKKDGKKSAGVIAQDVEKVLPQAVKIVKDLNSNDEYKTVKYDALISILVESIKELSARVEELESK